MAEEQRRDSVIEFPNVRQTAGGRMRAAREAAGLSLTEMAGQTKIPVRMLTLIEAGDYAGLPAKAYATGFSRTYARALGLDEAEILAEVRRELGQVDPAETRMAPAFEPGDPARVPTAKFAWLAAVAALAVLAAGLLLWRSYYAPAVTLPSLITPQPSAASEPAASVVVPLPAPSAGVPLAPAAPAAAVAPALAPPAPAPTAAVPSAAPTQAAPHRHPTAAPGPTATPAEAAGPAVPPAAASPAFEPARAGAGAIAAPSRSTSTTQ